MWGLIALCCGSEGMTVAAVVVDEQPRLTHWSQCGVVLTWRLTPWWLWDSVKGAADASATGQAQE